MGFSSRGWHPRGEGTSAEGPQLPDAAARGPSVRPPALSTNSSHRVVDTSHVGVLVTAAGSDASIRAITDVVNAIRTGDLVAGR